MRIFIAFPLPESVKKVAKDVQDHIKLLDKKFPIHWTDFEKLHITLEFLGEITAEKVEKVRDILLTIIPQSQPLKFQLDSIGAFPNLDFPHVLFIGIKELTGQGSDLHKNLLESLKSIDFLPEAHEWRPHITLGRIKRQWHNTQNFSGIKFEKLVWDTESVQIMESAMKKSVYEYRVLDEIKFGT